MNLNIINAVLPQATANDEAVPVQLVANDGLIQSVDRQGGATRHSGGPTLDGTGLFLLPGLIDLQVNGGFGYDFAEDPQTIWQVGARLPQYGVTSYLPTIVTSPIDNIQAAQKVLAECAPDDYEGSIPLGLHLEGPFLSPDRKGAHAEEFLLSPAVALIKDWSPATAVRLVTLAPELSGAPALVRQLCENGVVVSMGHSQATDDEARQALEEGVRYGTHLFNAMRPLHQREPGLIGALLADERPIIGLIADNIHVHPTLLHLIWRLVGPERLNVVFGCYGSSGNAGRTL